MRMIQRLPPALIPLTLLFHTGSSFVVTSCFAADPSACPSSCPSAAGTTSTTTALQGQQRQGIRSAQEDSTATTNTNMPAGGGGVPMWFQHQISVTAPSRGCHLITGDVHKAIGADLQKIKIGMCNLFIQ